MIGHMRMEIVQRKPEWTWINRTSGVRRCFAPVESIRKSNENHFRNLRIFVRPKIPREIYILGNIRSAFTTPSRARCSLGISVAASPPFVATLLYELTSNVLQRKLFDCIKITTKRIVGILVVDTVAIFKTNSRVLFHKTLLLILFSPNKRQMNDYFVFLVCVYNCIVIYEQTWL